jgi:hypothetical protein
MTQSLASLPFPTPMKLPETFLEFDRFAPWMPESVTWTMSKDGRRWYCENCKANGERYSFAPKSNFGAAVQLTMRSHARKHRKRRDVAASGNISEKYF